MIKDVRKAHRLLHLIRALRRGTKLWRSVRAKHCDLHWGVFIVLRAVCEAWSDPAGVPRVEGFVGVDEVPLVEHLAIQDEVHGPGGVVVKWNTAVGRPLDTQHRHGVVLGCKVEVVYATIGDTFVSVWRRVGHPSACCLLLYSQV